MKKTIRMAEFISGKHEMPMKLILKSELFAGVGANPALVNIVSKDFDVIEAPTRVTRGL